MKRMYSNEELVKLIQENAPEVEVDDALSNTSENPVQNKVIYGALEEKQDLLPTSVANKYLKTDANGDLEWGDAGGGQKYLHNITITKSYLYGTSQGQFLSLKMSIITSSATAFTFSNLVDYCHQTPSYKFNANGYFVAIFTDTSQAIRICPISHVLGNSSSSLSAMGRFNTITYSINGDNQIIPTIQFGSSDASVISLSKTETSSFQFFDDVQEM